MQRVILYHATSMMWELDYVFNELLKDVKDQCLIRFLDTDQLYAYKDTTHKQMILVFSSNLMNFAQVKSIVTRLKPQVVIHLSDEDGTKPEFCQLGELVPLVLRQHRFAHYPTFKNVIHIPLGYMTGYPTNVPVVKMDERDLTYSFVGSLRSDRKEMLDTFQSQFPEHSFVYTNGGMKVDDMVKIYARSKFVLNGRGLFSLNCFRLYEAIKAGAIPVTCGRKKEWNDTFDFDGSKPPFIHATTWVEAAEKCKLLLDNPIALQVRQEKNMIWLQTQFQMAREHITHAFQ